MGKQEKALAKHEQPGKIATIFQQFAPPRKLAKDKIKEYLNSGDSLQQWGAFKDFVVLKEGDVIQGIFRGAGAPRTITDKITGEEKSVPTWLIQPRADLVLEILGSYQLDAECSPRIDADGKPVALLAVEVIHVEQVDHGQRRVNNLQIRWATARDSGGEE